MKDRPVRIIIDTNIWISFLIGQKSASIVRELMVSDMVKVVMTDILHSEIVAVAARPKFARYFSTDAIGRLESFLRKRCDYYRLNDIPARCRDPKDDYLLELAKVSDADILVTGDKDLTDMRMFGKCLIITIAGLNGYLLAK